MEQAQGGDTYFTAQFNLALRLMYDLSPLTAQPATDLSIESEVEHCMACYKDVLIISQGKCCE